MKKKKTVTGHEVQPIISHALSLTFSTLTFFYPPVSHSQRFWLNSIILNPSPRTILNFMHAVHKRQWPYKAEVFLDSSMFILNMKQHHFSSVWTVFPTGSVFLLQNKSCLTIVFFLFFCFGTWIDGHVKHFTELQEHLRLLNFVFKQSTSVKPSTWMTALSFHCAQGSRLRHSILLHI